MNDYDYGAGNVLQATQANSAMLGKPYAPSLKEQLQEQYKRAVAEVKRIEELVTLLDQNPDMQRILELMNRNY